MLAETYTTVVELLRLVYRVTRFVAVGERLAAAAAA